MNISSKVRAGVASAALAAVVIGGVAALLALPANGQGVSARGRCVSGRSTIEVTIPSNGGRIAVDGVAVFTAAANPNPRSLVIAFVGGRPLRSGTHTVTVGSMSTDVAAPAC